jgi:hypothetical protein
MSYFQALKLVRQDNARLAARLTTRRGAARHAVIASSVNQTVNEPRFSHKCRLPLSRKLRFRDRGGAKLR